MTALVAITAARFPAFTPSHSPYRLLTPPCVLKTQGRRVLSLSELDYRAGRPEAGPGARRVIGDGDGGAAAGGLGSRRFSHITSVCRALTQCRAAEPVLLAAASAR